MEAKFKDNLPQEGTSSTRAGESLPEPSSGCPAFSGGGRILRSAYKQTTSAPVQRTTDVPIVVVDRDPSLDFSVKHWADGSGSPATVPSSDCRKRSHLVDETGAKVDTHAKVSTSRRGKSCDPANLSGSRRAVVSETDVASDGAVAAQQPSSDNVLLGVDSEGFPEDIETLDPARLRELAAAKVNTILEVCKKSGNLKGTSIKELKDAARTLQEVTSTALTRTVEKETLILRRETRKLRNEVAELKAELAVLRERGEAPPPPPDPQLSKVPSSQGPETLPESLQKVMADYMEGMERSLRISLGEVVTARIEALEDRLLPARVVRPPLAADKNPVKGPATSKRAGPRTEVPKTLEPTFAPNISAPADPPLGMEWGSAPATTSAAPDTEGWTTVARRRRRKRPKPRAVAVAAPISGKPGNKRKRKRKLPSAPRSAAVVITLQPAALESGFSYKAALLRMQNHAGLADLKIEDISLRHTATGARIIEIPGARRSEQADGLAKLAHEVLGDMATVARPVKRANIRIVGLDETVSEEDVVTAASAIGGCDPALIRAGEIRPYGRGIGAIHLSLPVGAARMLMEAGRLRIGWSVARVRILKAGPLRCFKCMDVGHTRPVCQSEIDRGQLCFRCGLPGHKAQECKAAKLHCALCADAGRPADHVMAGAKCRPSPEKGRPLPASKTHSRV